MYLQGGWVFKDPRQITVTETVTATSPHWRKTTATNFLSELIAERGNWDRRILISPMNFYVNGKQYSFISSNPKYLEYRKLHLEPAPCTLALHSMCNCTLGSTRICNSSLVTSNLKYAPRCYKRSHPLRRWSNYFAVRRWISDSGRDWKRLQGALEKKGSTVVPAGCPLMGSRIREMAVSRGQPGKEL